MARIMAVTVNSMVSSPTNGAAVMKFSGKDRKEGDGTDASLETMQSLTFPRFGGCERFMMDQIK